MGYNIKIGSGDGCLRETMSLEKVFKQIDANRDEYLRRCLELLRQPSVSIERENIYRCAEMVPDNIRRPGPKLS